MGGASDKRYNLSFIVENSVEIGKPIIGLSMAYRLSAWGFLDGKEVRDAGSTNVGIHDQRLALQWIQENIGAFGGDPSKVYDSQHRSCSISLTSSGLFGVSLPVLGPQASTRSPTAAGTMASFPA